MRILHITNAYPYDEYTGYGIFIKEQIDSLTSLGIENKLVFINARHIGSWEYIRKITEIREQQKFADIIHCHHPFSLLSCILARCSKPVVLSVLGDIQKQGLKNKFIYSLVKNKPEIIIHKKSSNQDSDKITIVPNGVDTDLFKPLDKVESKKKLNLDVNKKYALFVSGGGINVPVKRHDKFIEVLKKLALDNIAYEPLYLVNVEREAVPLFFNAADILLLTSDSEGSPNAVKEAMACNLKIITANVGDVETNLSNVKGCYVSLSNSVEELCSMVKQAEQYELSEGRIRLFELGLDMPSVAKKLFEIYKSIQTQNHNN